MDKAARRNRNPTLLPRVIRPQRGIDIIGNKIGGRRKRRQISKTAGLRKQRRLRPAARAGAASFLLVYFVPPTHPLAIERIVVFLLTQRGVAGIIPNPNP